MRAMYFSAFDAGSMRNAMRVALVLNERKMNVAPTSTTIRNTEQM